MREVQGSVAAAAAAAGLGVILLGGCAQEEQRSTRDYLEQAQAYREEGRVRAGVLALKNALKQEPRNAKARRLLGEMYLAAGNPGGAAKELRRGLELGAPREAILVPLGQALLKQGKHDELLSELEGLGGLGSEKQAKVLSLRGLAHLGKEDTGAAQTAFERALEQDSTSAMARRGKARIQMARGNLEAARDTLNDLLKADPDAHRSWRLMGHLERLAGRAKQAEAAFTMAIARSDSRAQDYLDRAMVRLFLGNLEGVKADIGAARAENSGHPRIRLIQGILHLKKGQFTKAQARLEEAMQGARKTNIGTFYLGVSHYAQENWEQSRQYLGRFLEANPESHQTRAMLAALALRQEEYAHAEELLKPALTENGTAPRILGLMGQVKMATGQVREGAAMLRRVQGSSGEGGHRAAGLALLTHGNLGSGVKELERALETQPDDPQTNLGLVLGYLGNGQFDKAYKAAERLKAARPGNAVSRDFMALALLGKGEAERAFSLLEQVQADNPGDPISGLLLASRAERQGKAGDARAMYNVILQHHPEQREARMRLAQLERRTGNRERAQGLLRKAVENSPEAPGPRSALARLHLEHGEAAAALDVAESGLQSRPDHPGLLEAKGRAQLALERPSYAVETFRRLAKGSPESAPSHLLLGKAYLQAGQPEKGREALEEAVAADPEFAPARIILARLLLRQNRTDRAGEVIGGLREDYPDSPRVLDLAGELAFRKGDAARAADLYGRANERAPATRFVTRQATAQWAAGERTAALRTLNQWLAEHPQDATARLALAQRYQGMGKREKARSAYRTLLDQNPENPVVHNNLAWLLREEDPEKALSHADRARELAPESPEVLDTYGMLLLRKGEKAKAVRVLRRAVDARPKSPILRYHLAQALAEQGETGAARGQLGSLLESKTAFPKRKEAQALLERLGG
jgi:putative PEP-CTERM system TPR-repeat lipoprotein